MRSFNAHDICLCVFPAMNTGFIFLDEGERVMKKIKVEQAVGQTLCHDMTAIMETGFKCVRFKRGHVISQQDIPQLLDMGKAHIYVWEPGKDEVHEDDAARAVTKAVCGENLEYTGPSEGKFQMCATIDGLFCVNSRALRLINSVDDYTIATLKGYSNVCKGDMLAGIRIIPLVTGSENVEQAVKLARENYPVLSVMPYTVKKAAVVITGSEIYNGRIQDRFEPVLRKKLIKFGADLDRVTICDDDLEMIAAAIESCVRSGIELILLTGGMSVDPDDLTPTAIRKSGARIVTQGVPIQPGNMLTIAYLGNTAMIGVPGASIHSPVTSLDVFLPRIMAGVEIHKSDIAGYGEGGLCIGCDVCSYPACYFGSPV